MTKNEWYSAKFDAESSKLIFTVLDRNEKNSLISNTGITGNIVDILKKENVKTITMGETTFTQEDATKGPGAEGTVWSKFGEELATLTGKGSFDQVTLGDLVGKNLTLTITVDDDKARTHKGNTSETYTIEFVYNAKATIDTDIPESDATELSTKLNYQTEDTYTITKTSDGLYTVTGGISQQKVKGFGKDDIEGYYFAYTIELDEGANLTGAKVKVPKGDSADAGYNEASFDENTRSVTVLMEVESSESTKYRDIIVEVDGVPTKIRIDFSRLELRKASTFTINNENVDEKLKSSYGWSPETDYEAKFATEGNKVTVTGVIPYLSSWEDDHSSPYKDKHETGYYFGFVVNTTEAKKDNTTVTIRYGYEGDEEKVITSASFDDQNNLYLLGHLHPEDTKKTFDIIVDLDGSETVYNPYTLTVDCSQLLLQKDSETEIKLHEPSDADEKTMTSWNYKEPTNLTLSEDGILKGKLVEQQLTAYPFGDANKDGYYFDFKFTSPDGVDKSKAKIAQVETPETTAKVKKEYKAEDFDDENNLTILFRFAPGTTGCETCKGEPKCEGSCCEGSGTCNCDKKLYYRIDWDGEGKEYLPMIYVIDYCGVTFEKSSIVEISDLDTVENFEHDNWKGFDEDENYSTKFVTEGDKVKVTGLITIFNDDEWSGSNNPFGSAYDYYLAFKLKKAGTEGTNTNTTVKFLTEEEGTTGEGYDDTYKISKEDFGDSNEIYVLKYINPFKDNSDNKPKQFTLKVDFDDGEEEYAEYSVTIDWSGLKFQTDSNSGSDYEIVSQSNISSEDKTTLEDTWGYDFSLDSISYTMESQDEGDPYHVGLEGTVKQQTLESAAGFDEAEGYYVPVKITIPKDDLAEEYHNSWTIYIKEGGKYVEKKPSETDYTNGYIVVLFKMNDGDDKIHYKVDYDGSTGNDFLMSDEITIKTKFTYLTENKVIFEYFDEKTGEVKNEEKIVYQNEKFDNSIAPVLEGYTYHDFDYWYDTSEDPETEFNFKDATTGKDQDITLKAHWTIDVDSFLIAVIDDLEDPDSSISEDFSEVFEVSKTEDTITFKVISATALLSDMNRTSIPGTIAYLLQRGEIQDITLAFGGKKVVFTKDGTNNEIQTASLDPTGSALKEKIQAGAKALFQDVLSGEEADESTMTLNKMAVDDREFTLTIGKLDDSVQLKDGAKTEYTFDFITDVTGVTNETQLKQALANNNIKHIDILSDFTVDTSENTIDIGREVVINGGVEHHKLTASNGDTIFNVKSPKVTIDAIKLDAKTPIVVTSGSLTTTGLTVEGNKAETAVEVKNGATLNISELTFDGEKYTKPAVKAEKGTAKVNFKDNTSQNATKLEKIEKITTYEEQKSKSEIKNHIGDYKEEDISYQYYNYYNKAENGKIYKTTFHSHEFSSKATFERYNYYGEKVTKPNTDDFKVFKSYSYDGYTYTLIGFAESRDDTLHFGEYTTETVPEGVTKVEEIEATSDKLYYAAYNGKVDEDTKRVEDAEKLYEAIQNPDVSKIYIINTTDLDLTSKGPITINRPLSIVGPTKGVKIKVKNIKIESSANDVFFHRLNIEADPGENVTSLIDVQGEKFTLWQSSLKNVSVDQEVDSAIKYSGNKAIVDIRWNTFDANNIKNTFIDVEGNLAGVTDIYYNTFAKLTTSTDKKSAITIKEFDESAKISEENDETISIDFNTFNDSDYAIKILKEASSGPQADISIESSKDVVIAVEYDESHKDFSKINIHPKGKTSINNIKLKYINGTEEKDQLDGDKGVKVVTSMEMQGIKVPEQAVVKGLKLNGDTYSGVISQSEDGNFYLPVTLTSNDFEDRVSTVKVTDPNGNAKTYTYGSNSKDGIATVSNANTMNLQLEAIKSSKITGNNGKVYKLELDADGEKSNAYKVKEYTINYSGVETLEEKINKAAKATLEANSFTVTKNNKINGYTEEFTYKYNANDGLTYLKAEKDNVEEYTFSSAKYAGVDSSKLSVVARKIKDGEEDSGVYLNDWVYVHPQQVGRAIHEVTMLTDVMKDSKTSINAIDTVELVDGEEHKYTVKLNGDKYTDWVKNNYLLTSKYTTAEWGKTVLVDVELDENDQYIKSIKTQQESSSNTFNVAFTNVNKTNIEKPTEFLSTKEKKLTNEDIKDFYEKGKAWWDKHIHENAYTQQ